jgi:hypothetical protein
MAIHRSVHEAKGVGCGQLQRAVVALGSSGSSASLRKMRHDFIPPRRCQSTPHLVVVALGHRSQSHVSQSRSPEFSESIDESSQSLYRNSL